MKNTMAFLLGILVLVAGPARAQDCTMADRACVAGLLQKAAESIDNASWRDQTYRELAKTLAFDGRDDEAMALIDKIQNPDTKAMTVRGIGMAIADRKLKKESFDPLFQKLRKAADKITDPPSFAIALTYIAMSQAFAGDNEGAWATAASMENAALRHKAYGETAEIQAERGDYEALVKSIGFIETESYRNKSSTVVAKILADGEHFDDALKLSQTITNPYLRAEALQYTLDKQKPREIPHQ
ncbi:MAG: hypothetical protein IT558_04180 [Alphaproteobacteria bacterium]|nr:hypothetical protein [Alphaproteobacteria bacterium]